jgi:hypothetical protein
MRHRAASAALACLTGLSLACGSAHPAGGGKVEFIARSSVIEWMDGYRLKPEPARLPAAVRTLSETGALRDPEAAGFAVGFVAGVLAIERRQAERLIGQMLPLPAGDQWLVVRAVAYSGLPAWKSMLARLAARMPERRAMIDLYLAGRLPALDTIELDKSPTMLEKIRLQFGGKPDTTAVSFGNNPELLDTLWGYYFATGDYRPIWRMLTMLPWSKDNDSVSRLNAGSAAKYTLASNASRYPDLLAMLKEKAPYQDPEVASVLTEVIRAAETMDAQTIKKQQLTALDEIKRKGPGYQRDMKLWGYIGQGTIAVGCIAAAAVSLTSLGLPCVIGGAVSSAAINYWAAQ